MKVRPYKREDKSPTQSTAEWRKACAVALSFDEKVDLFRILYQLSMAGNVSAVTLLMQYGMGKPGVGAAGKLADDVAADSMQTALSRLPPEKLQNALELLNMLYGTVGQSAPVTVDAPPQEAAHDPGN
jgi:hypothetical protein